MNFTKKFLEETNRIIDTIDVDKIEKIAVILKKCRDDNGRLFFIGVGGSAGHCSHAVNDFRKICGFQAFTPTDNVSELTARINDEGWENSYKNFLIGSLLNKNDAVFIFSVGGGSKEKNISVNLINAFDYSREIGSKIISITGKKDGYASKNSDVSLIFNISNETYHTSYWGTDISYLAFTCVTSFIEKKWNKMGISKIKLNFLFIYIKKNV